MTNLGLVEFRSHLTVGVVLFQNRQEFLADVTSEVDRIALHALSILATSRGRETEDDTRVDSDLMQHLFDAAASTDRAQVGVVVREMQRVGISNREIGDAYVPAIAFRLGKAWENDSLSFGTVAIGCARLQTLLRQFEQMVDFANVPNWEGQRNFLVVVPKDAQHTLGAIVLAGQLRASGVSVTVELGVEAQALSRMVKSMNYEAVMISAAMGECHEKLASLVRAARCSGVGPKVIIGGGVLDEGRNLVAATGTDFASNNWQEALYLCSEGLRLG